MLVAAATAVHTDQIPQNNQAGDPLECRLSGEQTGPVHRLRIPEGYVGCPGWHRTYMIPLVDLAEDRFILVSWTGLPYPMESTLAESLFEHYTASGDYRSVTKLEERNVEVGGTVGERVVFRYYHVPTAAETVSDSVVLTSTLPHPDFAGHKLFGLGLALFTSPEHYEADLEVFDALLASVRQDPEAR